VPPALSLSGSELAWCLGNCHLALGRKQSVADLIVGLGRTAYGAGCATPRPLYLFHFFIRPTQLKGEYVRVCDRGSQQADDHPRLHIVVPDVSHAPTTNLPC
jgi:hypothetical protein